MKFRRQDVEKVVSASAIRCNDSADAKDGEKWKVCISTEDIVRVQVLYESPMIQVERREGKGCVEDEAWALT